MIGNLFWNRIMGLSGILGGLILFAGDMLLYYGPINTKFYLNMASISDFRVIASGVSALFATWFYMIGMGHVFNAFRLTKQSLRNLVLICFGCILIAYGIVHGAFIAIATSAKLSTEYNLDVDTAISLARETNQTMRMFVYPIFALLSFVFISQVWKRNTLYPRWIILFYPLTSFLFQTVICENIPESLSIIVCGGFLNIILIIFFTASSIALWNKKS